VAAWLVVAVGMFGPAYYLDISPQGELKVSGSESQTALDLLSERFPEFSGISAQVVFHDPAGIEAHADSIAESLARAGGLVDVALVSDPWASEAVSPDGTTTIVTVRYSKSQTDLTSETYPALVAAVAPPTDAAYITEVGGALGFFDEQDSSLAELIGFMAAIVILLVAFGGIVATGLPIIAAVLGLGIGLSAVRLLALVVDMPASALQLATMIGIGVGIDYALLIVTRHREMLRRYRWEQNAIALAARTAGRAVVFAGFTVMIAILGLVISGVSLIAWMGVAAAIVVLVMVVASATLVPAMLGVFGRKVDSLGVPGVSATVGYDDRAVWARWGRHVSSHPWPYVALSLSLLVLLSLPLFDMRLGQSDAGSLPASTGHRRAYDLVTTHYGPGSNGPLLVAVDLRGGGSALDVGLDRDRIVGRDDVAGASPVVVNSAGDTAIYTIIPDSAPDSVETEALVASLREQELPNGIERFGAVAHVAGTTANFIDLADHLSRRLPWFIGAIVGLSFLFLVVLFRSIVVPIKAAILNLLSIGAGYGVLVAVFQWGWGLSLIGLDEPVPITSVIPMFLFAVLFGLSMDYEVFLLSRVREEYLISGDNTDSVIRGIAVTGRIITSAAAIMVVVFLGFVLSSDPLVKMVGLGLGAAILVDATIVRCMLVPATMRLFGRANWWLPSWLDRILPDAEA
jgi:putative drug exporter of the RND superfamily